MGKRIRKQRDAELLAGAVVMLLPLALPLAVVIRLGDAIRWTRARFSMLFPDVASAGEP